MHADLAYQSCRCMMHAFSLVIGSILGHPWAKDLVSKAQQIVTYFRSSHRPLALLHQEAKAMGITTGPVSANTTRFTSVHACLDSLRKLEDPLKVVVKKHAEVIAKPEVDFHC